MQGSVKSHSVAGPPTGERTALEARSREDALASRAGVYPWHAQGACVDRCPEGMRRYFAGSHRNGSPLGQHKTDTPVRIVVGALYEDCATSGHRKERSMGLEVV